MEIGDARFANGVVPERKVEERIGGVYDHNEHNRADQVEIKMDRCV